MVIPESPTSGYEIPWRRWRTSGIDHYERSVREAVSAMPLVLDIFVDFKGGIQLPKLGLSGATTGGARLFENYSFAELIFG